MTVETLALRCASCGVSLAIPRGPEHVTCAFCGTALLVRGTGGIAFLERDLAAIAGLGFVFITRAFAERMARFDGASAPLPPVLWVLGVGVMLPTLLFAASRWPGARRYARLRAELAAGSRGDRPSSPRDVE